MRFGRVSLEMSCLDTLEKLLESTSTFGKTEE